MERRLAVSLETGRAAQPAMAASEGDPDAPDDEAVVEIQPHMPAVEVTAMAAATATVGATGAPTFDEEGPVWPDEAAESAMRVEVGERVETLNSKAARELAEVAAETAAEKKGLPSLDALIGQIPADVRDTLEDLFRVKFTKVARTPKKALKE